MTDDDEISYLDIPRKEVEKVWCKIDDFGNLEYVDWQVVEEIANSFDSTKPQDRTEQMLIGKLMWLVRVKTLSEMGIEMVKT